MIENLRSRLLDELGALVDQLESDLQERQEWAATGHTRVTQRPAFAKKYVTKHHYIYRGRDEKVDVRLRSLEFKEGLTRETRMCIREISQTYNDKITEELARIKATFDRQFKENPLFQDLAPGDMELIMEGHKKECTSAERRIRMKLGVELETVRCSKIRTEKPKVRISLSDARKEQQEQRDRAELKLTTAIVREENRMRLAFEEYVSSKMNDCTITLDEVAVLRQENEAEVRKVALRKTSSFVADRERDDRMRRAKWLEYYCPIEAEVHSKLLAGYRDGMANVESYSVPQIEWSRALAELDGLFIQSEENWDQFAEAAVLYWASIALPKRRKKYDRIISRYATMYLSEEELDMNTDRESASTVFSGRVAELRTKRDELLCKVLSLDAYISSQFRIGKDLPLFDPKKKSELKVDYAIKREEMKPHYISRDHAFAALSWEN